MIEIPFQVSAKTARLIGRENVANADGAVIELVKNGYDADGDFCILYFDNKYNDVPEELSEDEYTRFSQENELISSHYVKNGNVYKLDIEDKDDDDINVYDELKSFFHKKTSIYIIDNGVGMDDNIIKNHWMTIGTNYKEVKTKSDKGRVLTGAKGIGRFALDRLGEKATMYTRKEDAEEGFEWKVNWGR